MRCVLIATREDDVEPLREVLAEEGLDATSSSVLGSGAALALSLDDVDAAVAVIPRVDAGLSAILVELGIVVGRGLPLLVIIPPGSRVRPTLAGLRAVIADPDSVDALRLHVKMFAQSLGAPVRGAHTRPPVGLPLSPASVSAFRTRLEAIRGERVSGSSAAAFEDLAVEVLRAGGAIIERDKRLLADEGIDAVAVIPGEERRLGPLLVEAKLFTGPPRLRKAARELLGHVMARGGGGLGLLIYESPESEVELATTPLVISLSTEVLLSQLERMPLAEILARARNEAIHRI